MASHRRSGRVSNATETSLGKKKGKPNPQLTLEDNIDAERASLIQDRQSKLEAVVDKHDDYVREAFHLEKFVSLLSYDPQTAKMDNSSVFRDYKSRYDLLDQRDAAAGPSRRTRRAQNEYSELLKPSNSSPVKLKAKEKAPDANQDIWSLLAETRSKDKTIESTASTKKLAHTGVDRKGKGRAPRDDAAATLEPVSSKRPSAETASAAVARKKRKIAHGRSETTERASESIRSTGNNGLKLRISRAQRTQQDSTIANSRAEVTEPPNPTARKLKLIVRPPPPALSNPDQRPPLPHYGGSISNFLSSFTTLHDGKDTQISKLESLAKVKAAVYNKRDLFKQQGRLIVGFDPGSPHEPADDRLLRSCDVWDSIIDSIASRDRSKGAEERRMITSQIVEMVDAYWEVQALKQEKLRVVEEKRLRSLAKETVKLVVNEWKRALLLIREQERLELEAEERRRGSLHLDAILDQSGRVLETQQIDLSRGESQFTLRSKSRSTSPASRANISARSDAEEQGGEREGSDDLQSDTEEEEGLDEDDEAETADLLGLGSYTGVIDSGSSPPALTDVDLGSSSMVSEDPHFHIATHSPQSASGDFPSTPVLDMLEIPSTTSITHDGDHSHQDPTSTTDLNSPYHPLPQDSPFQKLLESPIKSLEGLAESSSPQDGTDLDVGALSSSVNTTSIDHGMIEPAQDSSETIHVPTPNPGSEVHPSVTLDEDIRTDDADQDMEEDQTIPPYLRPFAVTTVDLDQKKAVKCPTLIRGVLRPYQQAGLEWLASLHINNLNGILADEMGLGKTIQTISLLAHLACDRGIWGPHLIIVPTSVLLNWEMEFKKFLPGFKVLSYHGNTKRRKELRHGWNDKYCFNVCITSYTLASRDAHIFKRKPWYYMVLDEAHMIKNFKSQRWSTLLLFRSFRRLLLTGTPLQNNLTELWALLQFLLSGTDFANVKEFGEWFSVPLEKAIEMGVVLDDETRQRVSKLHTVLRPYLLRRLKRDVEKELPSKFEHLVLCPLSKRQRFLYDEFMARADTQKDLKSGVYQKIANILMQLRKCCNHPDLFEVRPIVTSFAMNRSAIADYEIKEFLVRRQLRQIDDGNQLNMELLGFHFIQNQVTSIVAAAETHRLDATGYLSSFNNLPLNEPPPHDTRSIEGFKRYQEYQLQQTTISRWAQIGYLNRMRCSHMPIYCSELMAFVDGMHRKLVPLTAVDIRKDYMKTVLKTHAAVKSYSQRSEDMAPMLDKFAFATPAVVAKDLPRIVFAGHEDMIQRMAFDTKFDKVLHRSSVKLQVAFPDPSLLQYDCGKLQELNRLLRERKCGGHRVLIFTQMTKILDILELFLNYHGYLYLRLDGATKLEDRQYITERFNSDPKVFCFIASSRSGGVGINLTGADTVIFYDSDFNPQMDKQCEDRAHRIGQIRDVHIYRFISQYTVEEALLRKANQKRSLDDLVIQKGEFDWGTLFKNESALNNALGAVEDAEDARAAALATKEAMEIEGADEADFGAETRTVLFESMPQEAPETEPDFPEEEEGSTCVEYMLDFIRRDMEHFMDWRL